GRRADPVQCRIRHAAGGGSGADPHPGRADGGQAPAGRTHPHHRRRPQQVLGRAPRPGRRLWRLQLLRLRRPGPTHPQEAIAPVGAAEAAKGEKGTSLRSPTAHILETALALQRAPGERFRLRERPLPEGLVHVLEIASGSPQALAAAAAETGHDEQELLEAVRFYLEQVLFATEDADAYRVLGLAHDAPQDTIRIHHRWLQRWLHPDRAQAGDATVFATRVNQAWAQLRTPELRHDYDVRLAEARLAGGDAPLPADTVHRWEQIDMPAPSHGGRSRWLLAAALVACAVLAVLVFRHQETMAPWEQDESGAVTAANPGPEMDDRDVGVLAAELMRPVEVVGAEAGTGNGEQGTVEVSRVAVVVPEVVPPEAKAVPVHAVAPAPAAPVPVLRKLQA